MALRRFLYILLAWACFCMTGQTVASQPSLQSYTILKSRVVLGAPGTGGRFGRESREPAQLSILWVDGKPTYIVIAPLYVGRKLVVGALFKKETSGEMSYLYYRLQGRPDHEFVCFCYLKGRLDYMMFYVKISTYTFDIYHYDDYLL